MNNTAPAPTATVVTMGGRKFTVTTYVDPYPGMKGTDRITTRDTCSRCGGTGIFVWWNSMGECRGTCFLCFGVGTVDHSRAVSTLRREARQDAVWREHGEMLRAETAAKMAAEAAAVEAAQFAQAWDDAHAEQDRRNALVQGFVGDIGDKIDATGTVTVATTFEVPSFSGYGTDLKALVVVTLDDGHVVKCTGTGRTLYRGGHTGDRVRVTGTVKDLRPYRGQDQTILTRAKLTDLD